MEQPDPLRQRPRYWLHALLFVLTVVTTTLAGAQMATNREWVNWGFSPMVESLGLGDFTSGLPYALSFLAFLTCHEFGHYFMAMRHGVKASLPYYLPVFFPFPGLINIGSFGAVIRLKSIPRSTTQYFDIGLAGPLAGFVVSLGVLWYGFATLPELEYLYAMNPDYLQRFGGVPSEQQLLMANPDGVLMLGNSLVFSFFETYVADPTRLPSHYEMFHYPLLFAGFITLFFTALNLLPIGQLDGGHVVYGLLGRKRAGIISRIAVYGLLLYGGLGSVNFADDEWAIVLGFYMLFLFYINSQLLKGLPIWAMVLGVAAIIGLQQVIQALMSTQGINFLWLFYAFLAVRVIKVDHPPAQYEERLSIGRQALGWFAVVVFVLCFTPEPVRFVAPVPSADAPADERVSSRFVHRAHCATTTFSLSGYYAGR